MKELLQTVCDGLETLCKYSKMFASISKEMQSNVDKLTVNYSIEKRKSYLTIQDIIILEKSTEKNSADDTAGIGRILHMILLFLEEIVNDYKAGKATENLVPFMNKAYEETLKPYHSWITQRMIYIALYSKTPTRSQFLLSLADGEQGYEHITLRNLEKLIINIKELVSALSILSIDHKLKV